MDHGIVVEGLSKSYGDNLVLDDIGFSVPRGEFHALLGPSGSGKSTILRSIAGFVAPDAGSIYVAGSDVTALAPEKRNVGVVFQNYALFPHMSVSKNVTFGLEMRSVPKDEIQDRLQAVLKMVHLIGYEKRRPDQLSGGQQQRVALARALIIEPDLLLLDEPLSALDRKIRQDVREELKRIQAETGITTIIVTHDQEEALFLAQRMLVLDQGRVRQAGAPVDVYRNPTDGFVAHFVGDLNAIAVKAAHTDSTVNVTIGAQTLELPKTVLPAQWSADDSMELMVRPEHVTVRLQQPGLSAPQSLQGTLTSLSFSGPLAVLKVDVDNLEVTAVALAPSILDNPSFVTGAAVDVTFASTAVRLMAQEKAKI